MSLMLYLASNSPLDTVENPHRKRLSVNEALAMGITDIPEHMLALDFDRDMPDVILWSDINIIIDTENGTFDDGGFDDDFEIYNMDEYYGPTDSDKKFRVVIECDLTLGRAENILDYIRQQLEHTDELELWSIWLGDYNQKISWYEAKIQEFTAEDLVEIAELPVKQQPLKHHCVRIRKESGESMINKALFGIPVEIDEAATAQWYSKQEPWGCECGDCRNFLEMSRQKKLPEPVHAFLNELNIAPDKATYVCEIMPKDNGHLYQFSYRIAGRILNEDTTKGVVGEWGEVRCCHEPYPYGAPGFPTPHFDLEFWVTLPWVMDNNE